MNKEKIDQFLDINTTGEKLEQIMKDLLNEKFESELKAKYSEKLESEYNISRQNEKTISTNNKNNSNKIITLLLLMLLVAAAYFVFNNSNDDKNKVHQYLAENSMTYNETTRNNNTIVEATKAVAYNAFNKKEYSLVIELLKDEKFLSDKDSFFLSYSEMASSMYPSAANKFNSLLNQSPKDFKYIEETKLYYGLCLLKTDEAAFKKYYKTLSENSFAKKEIDKITN